MKLKGLWIPMLLLMIVGGATKICDTVFTLNEQTFFLDSTTCNIIFTSAIVLLLLFGIILGIADRKKDYIVQPTKNGFGGICSFIASVAIVGSSIINLLSLGNSKSMGFDCFTCIIGILGGAVLLFESCILFTGHNTIRKTPVIALAVPLWACTRLISIFSQYTKVSIQATEMFDIVSVALLLMFLFYQSSYFAEIDKSSSNKKLIVYAMAFVMVTVVADTDLILKQTSTNDITINNILNYVYDTALCGYALSLCSGIIKAVKNKPVEKTDTSDIKKSDDNDISDFPVADTNRTAIADETPTEFDLSASSLEISFGNDEIPVAEQSNEVVETIVQPVIAEIPEKPVIEEPIAETNTQIEEEPIMERIQPVIEEETVYEPSAPSRQPVKQPVSTDSKTRKPKKAKNQDYDDLFKMLDEMSSKK